MIDDATRPLRISAVVSCLLILSACASTPESNESDGAIFYPSPPAPARLQYLTKFSSQLDLGKSNESFRNFVFGDEGTEAHLILSAAIPRRREPRVRRAGGRGLN